MIDLNLDKYDLAFFAVITIGYPLTGLFMLPLPNWLDWLGITPTITNIITGLLLSTGLIAIVKLAEWELNRTVGREICWD